MPEETIAKTISVAAGVCVVCSIFVSTAAVCLKPIQATNKTLDMRKNILIAAGIISEGQKANVDELFKRVNAEVIDLATGEPVEGLRPEDFDPRKAARDPKQSIAIPPDEDLAGIKRRSKYRIVYFIKDGERIKRVILPVYGKGLWSTMYGLVALGADMDTIESFGFYEHGETPGLGGEVDNPRWKAQWVGKKAFDKNWKPKIRVIKGTVVSDSPDAAYEVDGLSGATLTARGVMNLVRFWLGKEGYGPFLARLRAGADHG